MRGNNYINVIVEQQLRVWYKPRPIICVFWLRTKKYLQFALNICTSYKLAFYKAQKLLTLVRKEISSLLLAYLSG